MVRDVYYNKNKPTSGIVVEFIPRPDRHATWVSLALDPDVSSQWAGLCGGGDLT